MTKARRIAVQYGGIEYAVADRELDEVIEEIAVGVRSDPPTWLEVAIGQGRSTPARLLLGSGIAIAVWQVNTDGPPTPRDPGHDDAAVRGEL
jgi:hypothetical protein